VRLSPSLDGQQRLTSLNIGLRGTYAYKVHGGWSNKPWSYPERRLYLNLLGEAPENEFGLKYHFQFLTRDDLDAAAADESKSWFPVSEIFDAAEPAAMMQIPARYGVGNNETAVALAAKLWQEIHHSANLHFYEENVQDIERVLDIFVRVNSGGTVLSDSDLLLSIATAQWEGDARAAVHGLVDSLNQTGNGFNFSRDTILKSGLVLADVGDIGFKVKNFTTANMRARGRLGCHEYIPPRRGRDSQGFRAVRPGALTADSILIPVAYYVHRRRLGHAYRESPASREDREALRPWVLRSLIVRGVWGSGLDTLLRDLREVIKSHGASAFPVAAIEQAMALRGKSLAGGPRNNKPRWARICTKTHSLDPRRTSRSCPRRDSKVIIATAALAGSAKDTGKVCWIGNSPNFSGGTRGTPMRPPKRQSKRDSWISCALRPAVPCFSWATIQGSMGVRRDFGFVCACQASLGAALAWATGVVSFLSRLSEAPGCR
jgi:hypothetical protein